MKIMVAYLLLMFGLGINYVFNISVARLLGAANFGDFSYAIYLFNIFSLIAVFSLDQAALRFIPQASYTKDIRASIQWLAILFGIIFSFIFVLTIFVFLDGNRAHLAYIFAASIIPFTFLTVNVAILQAEHIVGPRMLFRYVIEPATKFGLFLLLFHYYQSTTAPGIALFVALLVANLAALLTYRQRLGLSGMRVLKTQFTRLLKFVAPMSAGNAVSILSGRMDLLILGTLIAASDLGHYSAAFQTAGVIVIVLQGIETVYAPIFSKHIGNGNHSALKEDYQRALRLAILISSPLIMIFVIYPELIMRPFGVEYQSAAPILAILCIGQFCIVAMGSANSILVFLGKVKLVLWINISYVILTALCVSLGAHYKGAIGAAMGVVCAIIIPNVIRIYSVYKITASHPFSVHYLKILTAVLVSIAIGLNTKSHLLNLGIVLYPVLFLVLVIVFGIHNEEKQLIKNIYLKLCNYKK
jgi:O-antigen/teichoic acid export membrane protein